MERDFMHHLIDVCHLMHDVCHLMHDVERKQKETLCIT